MIDQNISHYRVIEKLGGGGMGIVYKAEDTRLHRFVALKFLPDHVARDPHALARFQREAQAASALNHQNICTIYDLGEHDGRQFLVMELLDGVTLKQYMEGQALAEEQVLKLGMQIADALQTAHNKGVIHRDVKPANVFVTKGGEVKVLDFGLAKLLPASDQDATLSVTLTEPQAVLGTLPYMAPEQLRGEKTDARADIWGVGAVLYEMATGHQPFREELVTRLIDSILHVPPTPPHALNRTIPTEMERIICKCLEKNPENRYQSARELAIDLRRLAKPEAPSVVAEPRVWLSWQLRVLVSVLLAVVLGGTGYFVRQLFWPGPNPPTRKIMLAVLPFENLSGDPQQEFFSDGLTEEMIAQLGTLQPQRLGVIARTSAMLYKGSKKPISQIGRELGVGYILEGSVRRQTGRVRVTAQLIQVRDQTDLWAESYEQELGSVFALQSGVAHHVASSLAVELLPAEQARLASAHPVNPEAHEAYLKGRYFWNKRTEADLRKAISYFQQAVAKDPGYALAYTGLADSYHVLWVYSNISPNDTHDQAKAAALRAVQIDDTLAESHTSLAAIAADDDWDFSAAEHEYRRALSLNPNYATAHQWYAESLSYIGRFDDALNEIQKSQELDPLSLTINMTAGEILVRAGKYDQAIAQLGKGLDMDKQFPLTHSALRDAYEYKHMFLEAIAENEAAAVGQGAPADQAKRVAAILREAYTSGGEEGYWHARVQQAAQNTRGGKSTNYDESPPRIASFYARLGDADSAVQWLQKALEQRNIGLAYVRTAPEFQALRSDPRVVKILRQMRLPE
jgi:eukaryotic-like serine/threonine-protein kinase